MSFNATIPPAGPVPAPDHTSLLLKVVMALAPFSLFLDPTSRFVIYSIQGFRDDVTGFPVSLFILPVITLVAISRVDKQSLVILQFIAMLAGLIIFSCIYNGTVEPIAYGGLWVMPYLWLLYFAGENTDLRNEKLLRIFIYSFMVSTAYLCLGGTLEIALYGGLMQDGRMSGNLVLPGQYQLYVYMPTIIALASLICIGALRARVKLFRGAFTLLLFLTVYALFLAAAREAILTFIVGFAGIVLCTTRLRLFLFAVGSVLFAGLIIAFSDQLVDWASASKYGAIRKFSQVQDADQQFGGRDMAISQYWKIFDRNMILGTGFRSPLTNYFGVPLDFPSAHNFYIDTLAWTGIAGAFVIFGMLIWFAFKAAMVFFRSLSMGDDTAPLARAFSVALLVGLLLSNNINVPMRQPLLAPIFGILLYGALFFSKAEIMSERGR